jgi:D-lactate dehydrogenase
MNEHEEHAPGGVGLRRSLEAILPPERVLTRTIDRIAFANDASVYRLVPRGVVQPRSIEEVQELFRFSHASRIPLTFRAAGTSLSGQAVTDGILVDVSRHWRGVSVEEGGAAVRMQPGVTAATVNQVLSPHQTKIGPDPASINACMMGGVLANNSSGMCCGVELNAYHTLESMVFVLPDGTVVDSSETDAEARFAEQAPAIARGLLELRDRIAGDSSLRERIRHKYRMKNTMGYSLNAFLDHSTPVAMLSHLMIGSEGTLGFIAEAALRTVPDYPLKHTGLLFFPDVPAACSAIVPLRDSGAKTLELMDRASLSSIDDKPGVPEQIRGLPPTAAALLVEYQSFTELELGEFSRNCDDLLPALPMEIEPIFTRDADRQAALWSVRKGLIPSVGAQRRRGTSMIIEDVAFPLEVLAEGVRDLQELCAGHSYDDAIVFGHAKDGNLHFVLNQTFGEERDIQRFDSFLQRLAEMVAGRYGGALKAEHSTGRNMAPFLETEWGPEAVAIMRELKTLIDPENLLNPGVILNDDPDAHLAHLKALETVEDEVDPCIECGFCERFCPSRNLTMTPRQRIVVRREMARLRRQDPRSQALAELEADYSYEAIDTCAADGLCATGCPVDIDTGLLVKRLRHEEHPRWRMRLAITMARHFGSVARIARTGLRLARTIHGLGLPRVPADLPRAASGRLPSPPWDSAVAVYLPSCVSRVLGPADGDRPLAEVVVEVCARARSPVWIPDTAHDHCCEEQVTPKLELCHPSGDVVLHPVCSAAKMELVDTMTRIVEPFCSRVVVPESAGCCGFAGDRGFLLPELTAAATAEEADEVRGESYDCYLSSSRTCEIGMTRSTGRPYRSFWYLLDEASR